MPGYLLGSGGLLPSTGEHVPGLAKTAITDRWLQYLIYAMTMEQHPIADLESIQEEAKARLAIVGEDWHNHDTLYRNTLILLVSQRRDYVLSEKLRDDVLELEKILGFIKKIGLANQFTAKLKRAGEKTKSA